MGLHSLTALASPNSTSEPDIYLYINWRAFHFAAWAGPGGLSPSAPLRATLLSEMKNSLVRSLLLLPGITT